MKISFTNNFFIFWALLRRDLKVLSKQAVSTFFDGLSLTVANIIIFGYLLPLLGIKPSFVAPVFLGSILTMLFSIASALSTRIVFDLRYDRFIDYHLTLPLSKRWLFAKYIVTFALELILSTGPLLFFSIFVLRFRFSFEHTNWWAFCMVYLLSILFLSIVFLSFSFSYSYDWFMQNIWPRRIVPLLHLGSLFYPWYAVYAFSPLIGYCFLANPITYVAEGLRAALLGAHNFLPAWLCIPLLILFIILAIFHLAYGIKKQLNPV